MMGMMGGIRARAQHGVGGTEDTGRASRGPVNTSFFIFFSTRT